jgi:hypothetical protein
MNVESTPASALLDLALEGPAEKLLDELELALGT